MTDFDSAAYVADMKQAEAHKRWTLARDTEADAKVAERRAENDDDPLQPHQARPVRLMADEAQKAVEGMVSAKNEKLFVTERIAVLKDRREQWERTLALHQDYLADPDSWGGTDMGGKPLNAEEQEEFIRTYEAALVVLDEELSDLGA